MAAAATTGSLGITLPHGSITFYGPTFDALSQQQHHGSRQNSPPQPRHNSKPQHVGNNQWQSAGSGIPQHHAHLLWENV